MTKEKNKSHIESSLLEDISTSFQENQAIIDACASDDKIMKEYVLKKTDVLLGAMDNFFDELRDAKSKYLQTTGKNFPTEKEKEYWESYFDVSSKLNEFYEGR